MRSIFRTILLSLVIFPVTGLAQTDSIRLLCPLNEATVIPPPKNQMYYDQPDLCIVMTSADTVVKACTAGKITNVSPSQDEEGKWDVVMFRKFDKKDYYFWYIGLDKSIVKRLDNVKEGQPLGYIKSGSKIEMLMYDFETPVDPMKHMECEKVLKGF